MEDKVVANDGRYDPVLFVDSNGNEFWRQPAVIFSRIVGYMMPLRNWNPGKRSEFSERKPFKIDSTKL